MRSRRRKYRNSLDFVESAFHACLRNANDLVTASKALIAVGLHAPGLALAVLALEELGKLFAIDGLLFARADDYKATRFRAAEKDHNVKLYAFALSPLFLTTLATYDSRYESDSRFRETFAIAMHNWKRSRNRIFEILKKNSLTELDLMKQRGLYSHEMSGAFVTPADAIDPALSDAVYHLAWITVDTVEFLRDGEALQRYLDFARSVRKKASEDDHQEFERLGEELFTEIFGRGSGGVPENA